MLALAAGLMVFEQGEFPLFNLPAEAVELVHGLVSDLEDKRALRLVCKRS